MLIKIIILITLYSSSVFGECYLDEEETKLLNNITYSSVSAKNALKKLGYDEISHQNYGSVYVKNAITLSISKQPNIGKIEGIDILGYENEETGYSYYFWIPPLYQASNDQSAFSTISSSFRYFSNKSNSFCSCKAKENLLSIYSYISMFSGDNVTLHFSKGVKGPVVLVSKHQGIQLSIIGEGSQPNNILYGRIYENK